MEKTVQLKAETRQQTGSKASAKLRKQGLIPAILYGHKQEPAAITLDAHDFMLQLHHGQRLMDVKIDKKSQKVLVKDLQYDPLGKEIIHADLMRVDITEKVTVTVPIELKGTPKGAEEGGIIIQHTDHLEVECQVASIPESIAVSVKNMIVGDTLHASNIQLPEDVRLISDPAMLMVSCSVVIAAKTTEDIEAETPVAPEVIGEAERAKKETTEEEPSP
ncbi:MAG: hypothetical protein A2167_06315 [Planctomycetes bacterium RBG_13_46_10]|nr:MAG: hypothetical protein A2167_06315 [Planctomycetes bacterium RBG_13_46_10]